MSKKQVKNLIAAASATSNDNDGAASMRLSQAAVNCANAMMQLRQIESMSK